MAFEGLHSVAKCLSRVINKKKINGYSSEFYNLLKKIAVGDLEKCSLSYKFIY